MFIIRPASIHKKERTIVFVLICVFYSVSLTQITYTTSESPHEGMIGLLALMLGWMDILGPGISWLANPLLLIGSIALLRQKYKVAVISSLLSVGFALSFLLFDDIYINEAGQKGAISGPGWGYFLWLISCITCLCGALYLFYIKK